MNFITRISMSFFPGENPWTTHTNTSYNPYASSANINSYNNSNNNNNDNYENNVENTNTNCGTTHHNFHDGNGNQYNNYDASSNANHSQWQSNATHQSKFSAAYNSNNFQNNNSSNSHSNHQFSHHHAQSINKSNNNHSNGNNKNNNKNRNHNTGKKNNNFNNDQSASPSLSSSSTTGNETQNTKQHSIVAVPESDANAAGRFPVSMLLEMSQADKWKEGQPTYVFEREGPEHKPLFVCKVFRGETELGGGSAHKKMDAKNLAAKAALIQCTSDGSLHNHSKRHDRVSTLTAVTKLDSMMQQHGWKHEYQFFGIPSSHQWSCRLYINNYETAHEIAPVKAVAKALAATAAFQCFEREHSSEFGARIAKTVLQCFEEESSKLERVPPLNQTCVAAIVVTEGNDMRIVSLGAGTSHSNDKDEDNDEISNYKRILDWHAEVLAKRGFRRFLYGQIDACFRNETSILRRSQHIVGTYELRPEVKVHLYVSAVPCGDACMFGKGSLSGGNFRRPQIQIASQNGKGILLPEMRALREHWPSVGHARTDGLMRAKLDVGESQSPLPRPPQVDDSEAIVKEREDLQGRIRKLCCSDKILQWNCLGLQGALLSRFIPIPLYLSSITVSDQQTNAFCHGSVARAVCCRLNTCQLPAPYFNIHHPDLHLHRGEEGEYKTTLTGHTTLSKSQSSLSLVWVSDSTAIDKRILEVYDKGVLLQQSVLDDKTYISRWNELCSRLNLTTEVSFKQIRNANGSPFFTCTIVCGSETHTVDNSYTSKSAAEHACAEQAISDTLGLYAKRHKMEQPEESMTEIGVTETTLATSYSRDESLDSNDSILEIAKILALIPADDNRNPCISKAALFELYKLCCLASGIDTSKHFKNENKDAYVLAKQSASIKYSNAKIAWHAECLAKFGHQWLGRQTSRLQ